MIYKIVEARWHTLKKSKNVKSFNFIDIDKDKKSGIFIKKKKKTVRFFFG